MPIFDSTPPEEEEVPQVDPVVTIDKDTYPEQPFKSSYRDNVVRSKDTDINALLPFIQGNSWVVDFYLDISGGDQANTGFSLNADEGQIFQQYHRIRDMEIKVTTPLSSEHNPETGNMYYEGTANFYARVKPNEGNVFVADIGDGRTVLFEITRAVPKSVLKNTVYEISYVSKHEVNAEVNRVLESSTVKTSIFVRESLFGLSRGFFSSEEHSLYLKAKKALSDIHELYGRFFQDKTNNTLMMTELNHYDPFVVNFVNHLPKDNLNNSQRYREMVIDANGLELGSIYQTLLGEVWPEHKSVVKYRHASVRELKGPYIFGGLTVSLISTYTDRLPPVPLEHPVMREVPETLPLYHTLVKDWYVFTPEFYTIERPMSVLEREVVGFIKGKTVDLPAVTELAESLKVDTLTEEERFYFTPLVMFLLCIVIREY